MVMQRNLVKVGNREVKKRYIGNKLIFEDLGDKTEPLSGEEIFTDKADDSVVHVEIDGKSVQEGEPSPDRPSEIHSLNDFDVVSSVGKENLLPNSLKARLSFNNSGGVDTHHMEGSIQVMNVGAGRALSTYNSPSNFDFSKLIDGEEYIYSYMVNPSIDSNMYIDWRNSKNAVLAKANVWTQISYTQKYDANATNYYLMGVASSDNASATTYKLTKPKIEKGNVATLWTPAPEDITEDDNHPLIDKINLSLSEPLRSVGDVKDRLFRDSDGLWKVERNVHISGVEILSQEMQDKLNNLRSFQGSNYVYTVNNTDISPTLHTTFKSKGWYDYYKKTLLK